MSQSVRIRPRQKKQLSERPVICSIRQLHSKSFLPVRGNTVKLKGQYDFFSNAGDLCIHTCVFGGFIEYLSNSLYLQI